MPVTADPALSLRFQVTLDGHDDLGYWSKCDGLTVEFEVQEYKEGGENSYVHRLPGRAKYQNIKLSRPVDPSSRHVAIWLARLQTRFSRHTARIAVLDASGKVIASWNLQGVYPVRWTGPSLDVGANQAAMESLELAHNGFLGG